MVVFNGFAIGFEQLIQEKLDPNTIGSPLKTDHVKFDPPKAKSDIESCSQIVTSCPTVVLEITDNPIAADVIPLLGQVLSYASTLIVVKAPIPGGTVKQK